MTDRVTLALFIRVLAEASKVKSVVLSWAKRPAGRDSCVAAWGRIIPVRIHASCRKLTVLTSVTRVGQIGATPIFGT